MAAESVDVESPLVLQEIDPSPVDETPQDDVDDSYFPANSPPKTTTNFLGLGSHGPIFYRAALPPRQRETPLTQAPVTRIQRYSTYAFTAFAALHITNTAVIPLLTRSVSASEPYLLLTRPFYQSRLAEPLLVVGPVVAHVGAGVALRLLRARESRRRYGTASDGSSSSEDERDGGGGDDAAPRRRRRHRPWWRPRVSGQSALGLALAPLLAAHAYANRGLPLYREGSSANVGLEFAAHGFARLPALARAAYGALVLAFAWHAAWGWARWLRLTPATVAVAGAGTAAEARRQRRTRWWAVNGVAAAVALVWFAGGLGVVGGGGLADGWQAGVYDGLYRQLPLVGRWI
jgi:hypothetical protein